MSANVIATEPPAAHDWAAFPGGELEGKRPDTLCPACRQEADRMARAGARPRARRTLCFQCYRADLERERRLGAAAELNTASEARFQTVLPFEPVNRPRLQMLKAERVTARANDRSGTGEFVDRRRRAQIAARHALQQITATLGRVSPAVRERHMAAALRAAELQLPESWLPFVVAR